MTVFYFSCNEQFLVIEVRLINRRMLLFFAFCAADLRQMHLENEDLVRDPTKAAEVVRQRQQAIVEDVPDVPGDVCRLWISLHVESSAYR